MELKEAIKKYKRIEQFANSIARKEGYSRATEIIAGEENKVVSGTPFGYRKNTTGEYVCNSYLNNFGWKNTYYQHAETIVSIKKEILAYYKIVVN
jgi:hypothetical protein